MVTDDRSRNSDTAVPAHRDFFADGIGPKLSPNAVADLRQALASFDAADPGDLLSGWSSKAEANARWFRQELSGADAGRRFAEYLEENGMYRGVSKKLVEDNPKLAADLSAFDESYPEKEAATDVRSLTTEQLNAAIDKAEGLIEPMGKALRAQNATAIQELSSAVASDPTQMARCVIGPVLPVLDLSKSARKALAGARERVDDLVKYRAGRGIVGRSPGTRRRLFGTQSYGKIGRLTTRGSMHRPRATDNPACQTLFTSSPPSAPTFPASPAARSCSTTPAGRSSRVA
ncbi:MAG: hypothetical protein U0573_03270 [Phycisphaerales bacterium]|nr:hypothetical protein [Planctomycetota bacterium]